MPGYRCLCPVPLFSKGMNKEALPVLRQVLAIDPTNTAARMMLLGEAVKQGGLQR